MPPFGSAGWKVCVQPLSGEPDVVDLVWKGQKRAEVECGHHAIAGVCTTVCNGFEVNGFEVKDLNAVDLFSMTKAEKTEPSALPTSSSFGKFTYKFKLPKPKQGEIQKRSMELMEGLRKLASPDATAMAEKATAMAKKREEGDQQAESDASSSAAPKATANAKKRKANAAAGEAEAAASSKKKGKRKA